MRLGLSPVGAAMSPASIHLPSAGLGHPPWLTFFCNYQVFFTVPAASHANMPLRFWSARPRLFPFPGKCATIFSAAPLKIVDSFLTLCLGKQFDNLTVCLRNEPSRTYNSHTFRRYGPAN